MKINLKTIAYVIFGGICLIPIYTEFSDAQEKSKRNKKAMEAFAEENRQRYAEIEADTASRRRYIDSLTLARGKKIEAGMIALKSFRKKKDEFEGVAFYTDRRAPYYTNVNFIYPYLASKNDYFSMRLRLQYTSSNWLFIEGATLLIDGSKYYITGNWKRDNNSKIWEWLDIPVGEQEKKILQLIANSKSAKVRYSGRQYKRDRTITSKEKSIIRKTLEVYDGLQ